ncbi:MAG: aminomethyl transferase family protein [Candidatus Latescibacteria bacterium]|nr:aminomethyl transferase family protein [Candidatus Latescibacterota bacterium]
MTVPTGSLEEKLQSWQNPVEMLRNAPTGPYIFPIAPEFSNWRDEQEAWHKTAVLFDLSKHMTDIYFEGPDLIPLLERLAVNSFKNFGPNRAKQIVCCNQEGFVIGDAILFGLSPTKVNISGRPSVPNWVAYHAETGDYDVTVSRDNRAVQNAGERQTYRFQVQGPNAAAILEAATGGPLPAIKFFRIGQLTIAGKTVNALSHGMARTQGLELWGPAQDSEIVRAALIEAGRDHGLQEAGARAYSTVSPESGWIPSPMPAIFSDSMHAYRQWLPADGFEANASLGGSFYSENIEDYYQTPWDLGYGMHVKFDHDFIGRPALEKMAEQPHRKKVWLVWNNDDVVRIFASLLGSGARHKYLEMPGSQYSTLPFDTVLQDGQLIGLSTYNVYTVNVGAWFSLAMLDEDRAIDGAEVTLIWGEEDGGSSKPIVERHVQTEVRATVHTQRPTER